MTFNSVADPTQVFNSKRSLERERQRQEEKNQLRRRDGNRCFYGRCHLIRDDVWIDNPKLGKGKSLHPQAETIDHVIPICQGGADTIGNKVLACNYHNRLKGDLSLEQFTQMYLAQTDQARIRLGIFGHLLRSSAA